MIFFCFGRLPNLDDHTDGVDLLRHHSKTRPGARERRADRVYRLRVAAHVVRVRGHGSGPSVACAALRRHGRRRGLGASARPLADRGECTLGGLGSGATGGPRDAHLRRTAVGPRVHGHGAAGGGPRPFYGRQAAGAASARGDGRTRYRLLRRAADVVAGPRERGPFLVTRRTFRQLVGRGFSSPKPPLCNWDPKAKKAKRKPSGRC